MVAMLEEALNVDWTGGWYSWLLKNLIGWIWKEAGSCSYDWRNCSLVLKTADVASAGYAVVAVVVAVFVAVAVADFADVVCFWLRNDGCKGCWSGWNLFVA